MIGILYESDEWSDWKLGRELEAALAEKPFQLKRTRRQRQEKATQPTIPGVTCA